MKRKVRKIICGAVASCLLLMPIAVQAAPASEVFAAVAEENGVEKFNFDEVGYVTAETTLNVRPWPSLDSEVKGSLPFNKEVHYSVFNDKWLLIEYEGGYGFISSAYIGKTKWVAEESTSTSSSDESNSSSGALYSAASLRHNGVIRWNGHKYTWYTSSQLGFDVAYGPIPGMWADSNGYWRDADGYICVASSDYGAGTVVSTPFGHSGKVYDCGCASGKIDIYTNW